MNDCCSSRLLSLLLVPHFFFLFSSRWLVGSLTLKRKLNLAHGLQSVSFSCFRFQDGEG